MRNAFVSALINETKKNRKIQLLTGDLGFQVFEPFVAKFPNNFTNAGVCETNMVGVAAGMAHMGLTSVCYSIAPFLVFRALEQIRNDVCYHNLDVKIVGVGGGLGYSLNGQSHCAVEDIAIMRALPNMTVICPGDPLEAYRATSESLKMRGPVYLRLGKKGEPVITYEQIGQFEIGKAVVMREGKEIVIFSTGNMLETAVEVSEKLEANGLDPTHIHLHTIKPLDRSEIRKVIAEHEKVVTLEEHTVIGGLGSAIGEVNSSNKDCLKEMMIIGVDDRYFNVGGSSGYVRKLAGIDEDMVVEKIMRWK